MLEAQGWGLSYPDAAKPALRHLNGRILQGDRLLILGPSGSGKSSLVASCIGLIPHSTYALIDGDLSIMGRSVRSFGPTQLATLAGVVFQDPDSQLTMLTVREEMAFGLENLQLPAAEMPARIARALEQTQLTAYADHPVDQLSGGLKQRLVIAALLAMQPQLLILDEPTAQLDPKARVDLVELLDTLCCADPNLTLVVIEHQLDAWLPLINRVWVLDQTGQLLLDTTPNAAFDQHAELLHSHHVWLPIATQLKVSAQPNTLLSRPPTSAHTEVVLQCEGLRFGYDPSQPLLGPCSLSLHRGEVCALVGSNGSGKTTLAQLCAGILKPQQGEVWLMGRPLSSLAQQQIVQQLGFVFQNPEHQFVTDRVFDELRFNRPQWTDANDQAVQDMLEAMRLQHLAEQHPMTLSHGQKRRLSTATMLLGERSVLIFDEPTFGQDPEGHEALIQLIQERANAGTSILLITHDMDLVWRTAHRMCVLAQGTVVADASPSTLLIDPERLASWNLSAPSILPWISAQ